MLLLCELILFHVFVNVAFKYAYLKSYKLLREF